MSLTPAQLLELQTIVLDLGEEFPHNADALWNAAIRMQSGGLGPTSGGGGQPAFDAAVADIKLCQEEVQAYQQRQGSPSSGFDVAVLQVVPATSTFPSGNVGEILYLQTAPNSYIATDQIMIDPVGPNSVQIDEVGTTIARSVPAASGGFEVNNLSTGAGFERVLTTSDSQVLTAEFVTLALSGQIPNERVLTGSANISVTDNGAGSTVVLDATTALTQPEQLFEAGVVVLNTRAQGIVGLRSDVAGSVPPVPANNPTAILDFYNITGVTRTGRVGYNGIGGNLDIFNEVHGGDVILAGEDAAGATVIGLQIDPDAITTLRGDTELQFFYGAAGNGFQVLPATDVSFRLHPRDGGAFSTDYIQYQSDNNEWEIQGDLILQDGVGVGRLVANVNVALAGLSPGTTAPVTIANNSIPASSTGSIAVTADVGTERGIFLGRSNVFHQNLTDRGPSNAEVKFDVSTSVITDPGLYNLRMDNVAPASVTEIAINDTLLNGQDFGTYWGPNLAVGDKLFIKQVNDDSKYIILEITNVPTDSTGWWRVLVSVLASGVIFDDDQPLNVEFVQAVAGAGGGGAPGGLTTEVQYNDAGAFQGSDGFVWDEANRRLILDRTGGAGAAIKVNNLLSNTAALEVGGVGSASTNHIIWKSFDQSAGFFWQMVDDHGLSSANHKLELQGSTTGTTPFIEWDLSGEMSLFGSQLSEAILFTGLTGTKKMKAQIPLYFEQIAAAGADVLTEGQFWVRNTSNGEPMFTNDIGTDFVLNAAASLTPWVSDIDADGFNLDDMGVIFMREQATADADVAGQGQIWVLDEGFTQSLMYTNDNGNDFELAALNLTDMNTSSLNVPGTAFVESLVFQPDVNRDYIVTATFELQSPAADDMQVEMVIDTNAVFKGVLTYASQDGTITGTFALESQVGDVITNIVVVPTSGNATPDGTYVTITGALNMGATSGTHSVRVAKNADTGADGLFVAFAALQASVLQVS